MEPGDRSALDAVLEQLPIDRSQRDGRPMSLPEAHDAAAAKDSHATQTTYSSNTVWLLGARGLTGGGVSYVNLAILAADVVGFSSMLEKDEEGTLMIRYEQ
jgi:class 3 adenylate cyclase